MRKKTKSVTSDDVWKMAAEWHSAWVESEDSELLDNEFTSKEWGEEWAAAFAAGRASVTRNAEQAGCGCRIVGPQGTSIRCPHGNLITSGEATTTALQETLVRYQQALQLIACPKRADGTWNRCREACQDIAKAALMGPGPEVTRADNRACPKHRTTGYDGEDCQACVDRLISLSQGQEQPEPGVVQFLNRQILELRDQRAGLTAELETLRARPDTQPIRHLTFMAEETKKWCDRVQVLAAADKAVVKEIEQLREFITIELKVTQVSQHVGDKDG